ncbi:MAG: hypothetical protein VB878_19220 [Pirellulaceae bacterium]
MERPLPQLPPRPSVVSDLKPPQPSLLSRLFAMAGIMVAGLFLLAAMLLLLMPLGYLGIAFVGGSGILALVVAIHYLVWGKWIKRVLEEEIGPQQDDTDLSRRR